MEQHRATQLKVCIRTVHMLAARYSSSSVMQLAWSPATGKLHSSAAVPSLLQKYTSSAADAGLGVKQNHIGHAGDFGGCVKHPCLCSADNDKCLSMHKLAFEHQCTNLSLLQVWQLQPVCLATSSFMVWLHRLPAAGRLWRGISTARWVRSTVRLSSR